jgi:peptidoglycan biosynthesis protein MviN/MurJ (putative lipid II flippase)
MINTFFAGERTMLSNYKTAAGIFLQDRWVTILRSIVNLILSLILVNVIGLPGIYVGTLVQGLIGNICEPAIIYKNMFHKAPKKYYLYSIKYIVSACCIYLVVKLVSDRIFVKGTTFEFIVITALTVSIAMLMYIGIFCRNKYFSILKSKVLNIIKR